MTQKLKIKVCGITNKDQVNDLLNLGVNYIGIIHHKSSPRHVDSQFTDELDQFVIVTVNQPVNNLETLAKTFKTKNLQLHGEETVEQCKYLESRGYNIIKAFSVDDNFDFNQCTKYVESTTFFLFDTKGISKGGNGIKFNWNKLNEYRLNQPFFLSGGISINDASAIKNLNLPMLAGIDLNSKGEKSPGIKDIEQLKQFINQIRIES